MKKTTKNSKTWPKKEIVMIIVYALPKYAPLQVLIFRCASPTTIGPSKLPLIFWTIFPPEFAVKCRGSIFEIFKYFFASSLRNPQIIWTNRVQTFWGFRLFCIFKRLVLGRVYKRPMKHFLTISQNFGLIRLISQVCFGTFGVFGVKLCTPPIAEILCVKNGRAIVVCGFLMK